MRRVVLTAVAVAVLTLPGWAAIGGVSAAQDGSGDVEMFPANVRSHEGKASRRRLPLVVATGPCTRAVFVTELVEYADRVSVRVERAEPPGICQDVAIHRCMEVKLKYALGTRSVTMATDGRPVPRSTPPAPREGSCTRLVPQRHEIRGRPRVSARDRARCKRRNHDGRQTHAVCRRRSR